MKDIKRITTENAAFIMIDMQEKLLPVIDNHQAVIDNNIKLLKGARELGLKTLVTEQYPKGMGPTEASLLEAAAGIVPLQKLTFSVYGDNRAEIDELVKRGVDTFILSGIEAHICVYQTAKDLLNKGLNVYLVYDALGSRNPQNHAQILATLRSMGAFVIPTETLLFELMVDSKHDSFKVISKLIK
ncbi:MAG: hypothetical protein CSA13_01995 [Clostridiales bacterium]|nr:MAG: hypothetical protein CSA13_01995 [Clostridiales bacterium]